MRSLVIPGSSVTIERRVPVKRLNNVDLPTLGRPTITKDGSFFSSGIRVLAVLLYATTFPAASAERFERAISRAAGSFAGLLGKVCSEKMFAMNENILAHR